MAKTSGEFEQEFIQTAKEKTGKTLEEWLKILKSANLSKQAETVSWLKKEQGLNHLQATLLAGIYLNDGKTVYANEDNLLENQFLKCEAMRPLFNALSDRILRDFPGTQVIPKKTYISFTAGREFAAVNIKPKEIRMGFDLGGEPFTERLQKSKLTGPMPRISHMAVITGIQDYDVQVEGWLKKSFERIRKK